MLTAADKKNYADIGIDIDALIAAVNNAAEVPFPLALKTGSGFHIYDEAGHNGLIGRVKKETLDQSTELGVKAVAAKAGVDYKGNDPDKLLEAVTAKLKLPVDQQVKERDADIAALRATIAEKETAFNGLELKVKDRDNLDKFSKLLPANKTKLLRDNEIRSRLAEDGITLEEREGVTVMVKAGEVVKDASRMAVEPKAYIAEWMKTGGMIEAEAAPAGAPARKTFDTQGGGHAGPKFDANTEYNRILEANGGKWNDKAQAEFTALQVPQKSAAATA